ncbi:hypothetical protein E2C01_070575 [Portunus trituberculatus]|uniref:Uncharacterized protein n=1 Tax=Portunus trituberculatus TaxID=210409 RepID=A0A5B7I2N2_PORTR|nr:hypothetical protein [Portunus trituberculatus]
MGHMTGGHTVQMHGVGWAWLLNGRMSVVFGLGRGRLVCTFSRRRCGGAEARRWCTLRGVSW